MPHHAPFQLGCYFHTEMKAVPRFRDKTVKPFELSAKWLYRSKGLWCYTYNTPGVGSLSQREVDLDHTSSTELWGLISAEENESPYIRRNFWHLHPCSQLLIFFKDKVVTARSQKKAIIRLSPWGLLDLLFGLYGLRLRKMHKECDWQALPFETTRRQSQSPAGAASASPLHWRLQHKAMGDKKPICPLDNLPADVSMSVLVIYHAARPRVDFLLTGSQLFEVTPCSHLFPR